jgi:molybdenum cofactor biosynthesis protein MoaC
MPYLTSSLSPTVVRAFSTSSSFTEKNVYGRGHKSLKLTNEEDGVAKLTAIVRPDRPGDRALLLEVITHGIAKAPLPPSLEEVRQKYGLAGPEYNIYWQRLAEAKMSRGGPTKRAKFVHLKAERKLWQARGRRDLSHFDLISEAQEIADKTHREERAEQMENVKQKASTQRIVQGEKADALKGLLEEAKIPLESDRAIKEIESKIELLHSQLKRITHDRAPSVVAAMEANVNYDPWFVKRPKAVEAEEEQTTAEIQRERKLAAKWAKEGARLAKKESSVEPLQAPTEIKSLLNTYNKQVETIMEHAQQLEDVRKRKEETLAKKRALLKQLQEQDKAEQEVKTVARPRKQVASFDLGDVLDDAMSKVGTDTHGVGSQHSSSPEEDHALQVNSVEDSALRLRKIGVGSVSVIRRPTTIDSVVGKAEEALADPIMEGLGISSPSRSTQDTQTTAEQSAAADIPFPTLFGSANKPDPVPLNWPLSQKPSTATQSPKQGNTLSVSSSGKKTSDNLRLRVSPAGFIPIDEDLVVSFDAAVPELQSQVFQMQQRLKSSYPRIDTLPYEIWTSENKRTLQTWLKILVSRWQTRFDNVEGNGQENQGAVDERVKEVLDQMVRDHNLSNGAAERMAVRWSEVFYQKGTMDGDAEGVLDWDEFHAGGMGFLTYEAEYEAPLPWQEGKTTPLISNGKRPESTRGASSYEALTRRLYSTSSHPPVEPTPTTSTSTSTKPETDTMSILESCASPLDASPAISISSITPGALAPTASASDSPSPSAASDSPSPSLPHLTESGSAHMVSVSDKAHTVRTAIAVGTVLFSNGTPLSLIRSNSLKKGDVLGVSRIAGIMAAKKCPDLIPLCHPIALTHVGVEVHAFGPPSSSSSPPDGGKGEKYGGVQVEAKVQCTGPTGVEMEAMTAVMGACLSVVDMCKAVDKGQTVEDVRVVLKEGGRSGVWRDERWLSGLAFRDGEPSSRGATEGQRKERK